MLPDRHCGGVGTSDKGLGMTTTTPQEIKPFHQWKDDLMKAENYLYIRPKEWYYKRYGGYVAKIRQEATCHSCK